MVNIEILRKLVNNAFEYEIDITGCAYNTGVLYNTYLLMEICKVHVRNATG
jgi:hypothetical protein